MNAIGQCAPSQYTGIEERSCLRDDFGASIMGRHGRLDCIGLGDGRMAQFNASARLALSSKDLNHTDAPFLLEIDPLAVSHGSGIVPSTIV